LGSLGIKLPLPPGTLSTSYNNDERYIKEYLMKFPGYYDTMDAGIIDEDGYVSIMFRVKDELKGEVPMGFVVVSQEKGWLDQRSGSPRERKIGLSCKPQEGGCGEGPAKDA